MTDDSRSPRSRRALRAAAAGFTLLGPGGAWLLETGRLDFGSRYLVNLWIVIGLAGVGLLVGIHAVVRGERVFGLASVVVNSGVAALYGFLALFFGLGGSR